MRCVTFIKLKRSKNQGPENQRPENQRPKNQRPKNQRSKNQEPENEEPTNTKVKMNFLVASGPPYNTMCSSDV